MLLAAQPAARVGMVPDRPSLVTGTVLSSGCNRTRCRVAVIDSAGVGLALADLTGRDVRVPGYAVPALFRRGLVSWPVSTAQTC